MSDSNNIKDIIIETWKKKTLFVETKNEYIRYIKQNKNILLVMKIMIDLS